ASRLVAGRLSPTAPPPTAIYTLSLHDALPIYRDHPRIGPVGEQPLTDGGEVGALPDEPLHDGPRTDLPCPAPALAPTLPGGEHVHLLMGQPAMVGVVAQTDPGQARLVPAQDAE